MKYEIKKILILFIGFKTICCEFFEYKNACRARTAIHPNKSKALTSFKTEASGQKIRGHKLLNFFNEISSIPHCSSNKKPIAKYIIKKVKENNLRFKQDAAGNIIIYKKAYPGLEKAPTIILQAHMDMVCVKDQNSTHDFTKDALKLKIKNNYLYAQDTTLGADNGIGIAAILAIIEDKNLKHGPLELLLTVDEELGSKGTKAMAKDFFKGKYLINLDSFNSNEIIIGSANTVNITGQLSLEFVCRPLSDITYSITIAGLRGGHSGEDIDKNRANAIKVLAYLIAKLNRYQVRIVSFKAGNFPNSIPDNAQALINIPKANNQKAIKMIKEFFTVLKKDVFENEINMSLEIKTEKNTSCMLSNKSHNKVLNLLLALPHGTFTKVSSIDYIPHTSTNLAIAKIIGQNLLIVTKPRSLSYSGLYTIVKSINAILNLAGAKIYFENYSPSWTPKKDSKLLNQAKNTYKNLFSVEPKAKLLHAVLEPANFLRKNPELDIISIGPNILNPHSTAEKVEIPSLNKFWKFTTSLIKDVASINSTESITAKS